NPGITISWGRMEGLRFKSSTPDEDDLRSFLTIFRKFISDRELVFLYRVYNICQQHITSDTVKGYLIRSREIWKDALKHTGIKLTINRKEFTPEYVTDLWINGYYFHDDAEKITVLKSLLPHERMLVKNQFLNVVVDATRQVFYVGNVVT